MVLWSNPGLGNMRPLWESHPVFSTAPQMRDLEQSLCMGRFHCKQSAVLCFLKEKEMGSLEPSVPDFFFFFLSIETLSSNNSLWVKHRKLNYYSRVAQCPALSVESISGPYPILPARLTIPQNFRKHFWRKNWLQHECRNSVKVARLHGGRVEKCVQPCYSKCSLWLAASPESQVPCRPTESESAFRHDLCAH